MDPKVMGASGICLKTCGLLHAAAPRLSHLRGGAGRLGGGRV